MSNKYKIGVIIITKGRKSQLEKCVNTLFLPDGSELVVVSNGYNKESHEYLRQLEIENKKVKCIYLDSKISKSEARNTGIRQAADSEIIYFLDDDSYPSNGNLAFIQKKFDEQPEVDILGGPNITPPGSTMLERISGYAFSELFTAWKMNERFTPGKKEKICTDASVTLCNLAFRRRIFDLDGIYFDGRLYYNEENLLLEQYLAKGRRIMYCPELVVYHHRRKTLTALAEQIYRSGEGRAIMTKIMPETLRLIYILPLLFVVYLLALAFFGGVAYASLFFIYLMLSLINAVWIMFKYGENVAALPLLAILPLVAHLAYGAGFAAGLARRTNE